MRGLPAERLVRIVAFLASLYLFLAAIELFGSAFKLLGADSSGVLFEGLNNPFAGLAVGILATVMVQSSSVTTSAVVMAAGTGALSLEQAVPVVMGANVGTSITNTLVSMGHITQRSAFRRAFAGATVHDMFNLLCVIILLPLELLTGVLRHSAVWLVQWIPWTPGGEAAAKSPIKMCVKWLSDFVQSGLIEGMGLSKTAAGICMSVVGLVLVIVALIAVSKNMRILMADRIEVWLNRVLGKRGSLGIGIGAGITMAVQSSSITTSLLVPMFGAGVLTLEAGFPIMLGANIGTTITALIASTVAPMEEGLTIAVVHLLFNLTGTLMFFPIRSVRRIPIRMSEALAEAAVRNRWWVLAYVVGVFVVIPLLGIWIFK